VANEFKNLKVCAGDKVVLKASGGVRYVWKHGDNSAETTIFPMKDSTYTVDVYNEGGCKSTDTVRVKVTPIRLLPPKIVLCELDTMSLDATNPDTTAVATYLWENGDQRPRIPISKPGIYTVTVKIRDCVYKQTTEIIYRKRPRIALASDTLLCFAGAGEIEAAPYRTFKHNIDAKLLNRESGEIYYYDWRYKGDTTQSYIALGIVEPTNTISLSVGRADTSYVLRIRAGSTNCETFDTIKVIHNCDARVKIPTAFTPNDDKLNDTFAPITSDLTGILIQVYHKWGDVVFEKFIDPKDNKGWDGTFLEKDGWDGTFGGNPVPMDSYQYVIVTWSKDRKGFAVRRSVTGNVQVIREFAR
jgi:gliding motility-associated-like protein